MKRSFLMCGVIAIFVAALFVDPSKADTPVLNITAPTGTVNVNQFPYNTSLTFTVTHAPLSDVNVLNAYVNGVQMWDAEAVGKPFDNDNNCKSPNLTSITTSCSTNGTDTATITVPLTIQDAGDTTLTVSLKHAGADGTDLEVVTFQLVSVEYPAPPAIANAYINSTAALKTLSGKRRGCIISQIANEHGKNEKYGNKPGPYPPGPIQDDVWSFSASCQ